ncbi:hydroxylamine reductase [Proteiniclasticum sediminis]|nr:hydroxylamine reductase [Proteiniclasticum sediminis]
MEEKNKMFCFQCEQTAHGTGCTIQGVCGKTADVANMQDLLIYQLKGISNYMAKLMEKGEEPEESLVEFMEDSLFMTLTNVNFNPEDHVRQLKESAKVKAMLKEKLGYALENGEAAYELRETKEEILEDAVRAGIFADATLDPDIRSVRETIKYGLKGISAYAHQARFINYVNPNVSRFFFKALDKLTDNNLNLGENIQLLLETGKHAYLVMETLDKANNETYEAPTPHKVNVNVKKGPFIVISGHDLRDLEMLLQQTEGKGVNIYTHGEMIPTHGYEGLKKYPHLVGNYGGAWQNQQKEFSDLPGCVLMTTNCLMRPAKSYADRIYTTNVVGFEGIKHIPKKPDGTKDFSEIIEQALSLGGFPEDEPVKEILVGFGHKTTLSYAGKILEAVKNGEIKHFFVIGGCDGAKPGRDYYTQFALATPKDSIILTLACGKYRFNKLDFGEVAGLPRLLDVGQCNDVYSAIRIAAALAEALGVTVNDLPLSLIVTWYEQKAVADLLALLWVDVKGIRLGPTLPAFVTPNVLNFLVENYGIKPITTPEKDLAEIFA